MRAERRKSKYGVRLDAAGKADRTVNGIVFASRKEADRYQVLVVLEHEGYLRDLELQPKYPLRVNGVEVGTYIADFRYTVEDRYYVEDCKGLRTPLYKLKKRMVEALYHIEILET